MNKRLTKVEKTIVDLYKDDSNYTLFTCINHGVFAIQNHPNIYANTCPFCKTECKELFDKPKQNQ